MKWTKEEDSLLRDMYPTMTRIQMAEVLRRTEGMIRSRCWTLGLADKFIPWTNEEIELLKAAYSIDKPANDLGLSELAKQLGKLKSNVCRKARALGLTNQRRKSVHEEQLSQLKKPKFKTKEALAEHISKITIERWKQQGHPRGMLGLKHSKSTLEVISKKSKERWDSMTESQKDEHVFKAVKGKREKGIPFANPRGSWKSAWREFGGKRAFFRSRWEANYGRYLEWLKTIGEISEWEHEAKTFWFEGIKRGCVSYLPDFKVTNKNGSIEWHEVKGWMDARSKTVLARMAKYHPNEKLVVIREKQYMEIQRKVSSLINGWETA